jgi:site-specific recombinase XerD
VISVAGFCIFMEQHIHEFLEFKTGGRLKQSSARDYRNTLNKFNVIVGKPLEEVGREDIIKFRNILNMSYSPKAVEHHFNIVHCFIKFWNPEIKTISHERIEVPRARSNPRLTITEAEHRQMLSVLEKNNYDDLQKRLMLNLLWDCGCRVGELCSINLDDMDFDNMKVKIDTEKSKKERTLFWSEETRETLCKILPIRWEIKRSNALFIGMYNTGEYSNRLTPRTMERWIKQICMRAGIKRNIVPHSYRHSRIQRWIGTGLDLISVSYLSGHENISSLEHYMRLGTAQVENIARKAM